MATFEIIENTYADGDVNYLANGYNSGDWIISTNLTHNNNLGSYVEKIIPDLTIGNTYKVSYTISSYTNCNVQMFLGATAGIVRTSAGTFTEILTLTTTKKIRFYSTGTATIDHYKIEQLVTTINDTPVSLDTMKNTSWTLSYNPILNQWISFHSYLPNNYLIHPTKFLTKRNDSQLYLGNSGEFGSYFDEDLKPFIIETIFNEYKINTKTFDSIRVIMDSTDSDGVSNNVFFDEGIVYTENQCSGVIEFTPNINITRKEKNWNFNNFSDITNNISEKVFVSDWDSIKLVYPIDKVINVDKIDITKPWYQRGRMRDKFLAIRFIENNLQNNKFLVKFVISSFRASIR